MLDQYQSLAALYDLLIPDPPGMLAFYRDLVLRHVPRGPVLEVGAGTGRLSLVLAAAGCRTTAVDASRSMLAVLEAKADVLDSAVRANLELVVADQTRFELGRCFPVVLVTGGTLQHCLTADAYDSTLATIRCHCEDGGLLALDIARMPESAARHSFRRDYGTYSGAGLTPRWTRIHSWDEVRYDARTDVTETSSFFEMTDEAGLPSDRFRYNFVQTFPNAEELQRMVQRAGFAVLALEGGFRGEPVSEATDQLVLIARAGKGGGA